MELSEEQFKELVEEASEAGRATQQLEADMFQNLIGGRANAAHAEHEKRRSTRVGVRYTVTVRPIIPHINVAATPFTATLCDVSSTGVGLNCPVAIYARFTLELPAKDGQIHTIRCTACSSRRLDDGSYHVGATFDQDVATINVDAA